MSFTRGFLTGPLRALPYLSISFNNITPLMTTITKTITNKFNVINLSIPEELENTQWEVGLPEADDAVVDEHEAGEEDQNGPDEIYISAKDDHFVSRKSNIS